MPKVHEPVLEQRKKKPALTQERVRDLFDYREDGQLTWRLWMSNRVKEGEAAGHRHSDGYIRVIHGGSSYKAHRLVWLWHHGYIPEHGLDHIDRDRSNNRIENLREVSRICNMRNTPNPKNNTSGVKGVSWPSREKKWAVQIRENNRNHHIGYFGCFTEAVAHRLAAEQALDWEGCDICSPAYQYMKEYLNER